VRRGTCCRITSLLSTPLCYSTPSVVASSRLPPCADARSRRGRYSRPPPPLWFPCQAASKRCQNSSSDSSVQFVGMLTTNLWSPDVTRSVERGTSGDEPDPALLTGPPPPISSIVQTRPARSLIVRTVSPVIEVQSPLDEQPARKKPRSSPPTLRGARSPALLSVPQHSQLVKRRVCAVTP
jgi:hypothetical protein